MSTFSKIAFSALAAALVIVVGLFATVRAGIYNIGADDEHTRPIYALMESVRDRSIAARAREITVPDLKDPARVKQGAGNYGAMCAGCHLTPGAEPSELSRGLYPAPPNLSTGKVDPAEAFWVIKHGIKASGMPAWGKSMQDDYIWNMVAFLQQMPALDAAGYEQMIARSGGHSHGGMEDKPHSHGGEGSHGDMEGMPLAHGGDAAAAGRHSDMEDKPHAHGDAKEAAAGDPSDPAEPAAKKPHEATHTHPAGTKPHND